MAHDQPTEPTRLERWAARLAVAVVALGLLFTGARRLSAGGPQPWHNQTSTTMTATLVRAAQNTSPVATLPASVGIGAASPVFRTERMFDIAGFKLAGLLQQVLSAHIALKVSNQFHP